MRLLLTWGLLPATVAPLAAQQPTPLDTTALSAALRAALRLEPPAGAAGAAGAGHGGPG